MSIVRVEPGFPEGAPEHITVHVETPLGPEYAATFAKLEAKEAGYRVKTLLWVSGGEFDSPYSIGLAVRRAQP